MGNQLLSPEYQSIVGADNYNSKDNSRIWQQPEIVRGVNNAAAASGVIMHDPKMDLEWSDAIPISTRQTRKDGGYSRSSYSGNGAVATSDGKQQEQRRSSQNLKHPECSILKDYQPHCAAESTPTAYFEHHPKEKENEEEEEEESLSSCENAKESSILLTYRDYSKVPKPEMDVDEDNHIMKLFKFPQRLHEILSKPEFQNIICWLPHGRSWKIIDPKEFEKQVLPQYFLHTSFSSFTRQVNGWGFRRVTINQYYHEMFLRGMPHVSKKMKRLNKKSMQKRREEGPLAPPGFHKFCIENPILNGITNNILLKQKKEKKTGTIGKMTSAGIVKQNKKIEYSLEDIKRAKIIAKRKKEFQAFKQRHQEALQVKSK